MASPAVLDFDALLAPISEDAPTGSPLRGDDPALRQAYQQVKDAREKARAAERQLLNAWGEDEQAGAASPEWHVVQDLAIDVLSTKSKDLWIAAWLLEALVRDEGFAGARDGFRLVRELCERYFDQLHPQPDEDAGEDLSDKVAQLTGLFDAALVQPLESIPLVLGEDRPLTMGDFKQAQELDKVDDPSLRQSRIDSGLVTVSQFEAAVRRTNVDELRGLFADIEQALDEFRQMSTTLDRSCGLDHAPPSTTMKETLEAIRDRLKQIAGSLLDPETASDVSTGDNGAVVPSGQGGVAAVPGRVASRVDAFRLLDAVADYFERTEPHSPVSYALRQAVRWGKMPLPELLKELISDDSVLTDLARRTGVPKIEDPESESRY